MLTMIDLSPLELNGHTFLAVTVQLPKTTLLVVSNDKGYIMCGALDVGLLNEKLKDRGILAGRAVGVKTIQQLLEAPLESVTFEAEARGIHKGMIGKRGTIKNGVGQAYLEGWRLGKEKRNRFGRQSEVFLKKRGLK